MHLITIFFREGASPPRAATAWLLTVSINILRTHPALRCPKKASLRLSLDFFDRCGNFAPPSSATGSGGVKFPTSYARRNNPKGVEHRLRFASKKTKETELVSLFFVQGL